MINSQRIAKLANSGSYERLLGEVLMGARGVPLEYRLRLSDGEAMPAAALGLALKRLTEITWRPGPGAVLLLRRLLSFQRGDGSFGSISGTAAALSGVLALERQADMLPGTSFGKRFLPEPLVSQLRDAVERAITFLIRQQSESTDWLSTGLIGDETDSVLVMWLLAGEPGASRALALDDMLTALEDRGVAHDADARPLLDSARLALPGPAMPSVAA